MNLGSFFVHLGHILGILSGDDPTVVTTNLTTFDGTLIPKLTTPILVDTTTLENYYKTKNPVSPNVFTTITSNETSGELIGRSTLVTGISAETENTTGWNTTVTEGTTADANTTDTGSNTTITEGPTPDANTTDTGSNTTITEGPTPDANTTDTGSNTTITEGPTPDANTTGDPGSNTTITEGPTTDANTTGDPGSNTTISGNETTIYGNETTIYGNETTISGNETTIYGNETTVYGGNTTVSGDETTFSGSTEATPTEKPGLSRGSVAGIVIGCLLLVAVIAAAIVFFVRNRNAPPEAQRLRV